MRVIESYALNKNVIVEMQLLAIQLDKREDPSTTNNSLQVQEVSVFHKGLAGKTLATKAT